MSTGEPSDAVLILAGPTGSGKSSRALDLAEEFRGVVINADSAQVYRELRVLTARPTPEDEARVPHRLYGVLPAAEACSAGHWLAMARTEIESARATGRLPIITGGTGLYLKALTEGLVPVPEIPAPVRAEARALHTRLGSAAFKETLAQMDPESAAKLPAADRQRLIRAYEVAAATGLPLPEWRRTATAFPVHGRFLTLALTPPRAVLYGALERRFDAMMAAGALDEVRALLALGLDPTLPALKALGVRELAAHLRGESDLDDAIRKAKTATRRLAKRQLTWFRHQSKNVVEIPWQYSERIRSKIFSFVRPRLLTHST